MTISERTIEALKPGAKDYFVWDSKLSGFGVRVSPKGVKTFTFQYRNKAGRIGRMKIGRYPALSVEKARKEYKRFSSEVADGADPSREREEDRNAATFSEFAQQYLKDAKRRLSDTAWTEADRRVKQVFNPAWGPRKLSDVRPVDVSRLHHKLADKSVRAVKPNREDIRFKAYEQKRGGPITANRCLGTIKAMFNYAERLGMIPAGTNPARGIKMLPEKSREKYLTPDELARLAEALNDAEKNRLASPYATAAIKLLAFTGARKSEILDLKWEHVDDEDRCLRLPDSKTGKKTIYLNEQAMQALTDLAKLKQKGNSYVVCGHIIGSRLINIAKPWQRICKAANLDGVHLHDLRHVFAGTGAQLGLGLTAVGKLLGHSLAQTTLRYSDMAPSPLHAAAEAIGAALTAAMEKGSAEIVEVQSSNPKSRKVKTAS